MLKDFEKLIAGLKYWNIQLDNPNDDRNYQSRLILQKLAFLCKSLGIQMNYWFALYKHGPYCPTLTIDYYMHPNLVSSLITTYKPTPLDLKNYDKIQKFVLSHPLFKDHKIDLLEAVTTVQFLNQKNSEDLDDVLFEKTKNEKPQLSDKIITIAINIVKELNFKPEFLTDELKKEIDLWDRAED